MPQQVERILTSPAVSSGEGVMLYREADSAVFKIGDLVGIDSNGRVNAICAIDANYTDAASIKIFGRALANSRNTTNPGQISGAPEVRDIPVALVNVNNRITLPVAVSHALGGASAANRLASELQDYNVGQVFQIRRIGNAGGTDWEYIALINPSGGVHVNPSNPVVVLVDKPTAVPNTEPFVECVFAVLAGARGPI